MTKESPPPSIPIHIKKLEKGERMDKKSKFLLLQVNDALFPIGGYSHSYGLETYIQKELVTNAAEAEAYIRNKTDTESFVQRTFLLPSGLGTGAGAGYGRLTGAGRSAGGGKSAVRNPGGVQKDGIPVCKDTEKLRNCL